MMNKLSPFKGLNITIPMIMPIKGGLLIRGLGYPENRRPEIPKLQSPKPYPNTGPQML